MSYRPGSFSKNFAWHGTGLRKLHAVIRDGFNGILQAPRREDFRTQCGVDQALSLIPANFFLHNRGGLISVDELVFQAIERGHSTRFDRLALFALHLNRAGSGGQVVSRPTMWANEFVRERLWSDGVWHPLALADASLDVFLANRMNALDDVRVKCRNNYRHIYELCDFWPTRLPIINSGAEQWIASALFLAWDRHILDGGAQDREALLDLIHADELFKLFGVTNGFAQAQAEPVVDLYLSVGGLQRFREGVNVPVNVEPAPRLIDQEVPEESGLGWLDQDESDEVVERRLVERHEQRRDRRKAAALKQHYENKCQFCGTRLQVAEDRYYSEAAHIKALGEPHNGPDKASNMLVLCPNHHLQFDRGVLRLRRVENGYLILSKTAGDILNRTQVTLRHDLDNDCVKYHHDWFSSART